MRRPADPRSGVWPTPDWLWRPLDRLLGFDLDAAASADNAKCRRFFTERDNGLVQHWRAESVWCNPPYGADRRGTPGTGEWVQKAKTEVLLKRAGRATLLVPVKAETQWYSRGVWGENRVLDSWRINAGRMRGRWYRLGEANFETELLELEGRVPFGGDNTGFFASAVVLLNPGADAVLPRLSANVHTRRGT